MLRQKIKANSAGIILYGLTPPRIGTDFSKCEQIAKTQLERLENSGIDGLVIYDYKMKVTATKMSALLLLKIQCRLKFTIKIILKTPTMP